MFWGLRLTLYQITNPPRFMLSSSKCIVYQYVIHALRDNGGISALLGVCCPDPDQTQPGSVVPCFIYRTTRRRCKKQWRDLRIRCVVVLVVGADEEEAATGSGGEGWMTSSTHPRNVDEGFYGGVFLQNYSWGFRRTFQLWFKLLK